MVLSGVDLIRAGDDPIWSADDLVGAGDTVRAGDAAVRPELVAATMGVLSGAVWETVGAGVAGEDPGDDAGEDSGDDTGEDSGDDAGPDTGAGAGAVAC